MKILNIVRDKDCDQADCDVCLCAVVKQLAAHLGPVRAAGVVTALEGPSNRDFMKSLIDLRRALDSLIVADNEQRAGVN